MLVLILFDVQYKESIVSSIGKWLEWSKSLLLRLPPPDKTIPLEKFSIPLPCTIWKILRYEIHPVSQECGWN